MIISFRKRLDDLISTARRLDALAVEAALNGRRPYRDLPPAELAEVLRILRRRGATLGQAAALLDADLPTLAEQNLTTRSQRGSR